VFDTEGFNGQDSIVYDYCAQCQLRNAAPTCSGL